MTKTKKLFAVIFFILVPSLMSGPSSYTVSPFSASAGTGCNLLNQGDFEKLDSIKNDLSLDYSEKIRTELKLRKKLLDDTLGCAINDAAALKANLGKFRLNDQDAVNLQSQFANRLDNAINYYQIERAGIDGLGLQGSKDFAKNLELWRDGNYKQTAKMTANFLIWAKNQDLMETAKNRVDQIERSVTLLRLVYNEDIQNVWREAEKNFADAKSLNEKAKKDLSLAAPDEALGTIKSSLDSLSKTYEKLADLVNAINKALALPS